MTTINPANSQPVATGPVYYYPMETGPIGQKVILCTEGRVAVFGVITEATRLFYVGWHPLMKIRKP